MSKLFLSERQKYLHRAAAQRSIYSNRRNKKREKLEGNFAVCVVIVAEIDF